MKKKILILLVLYLILPISVNALAGEVYVKCKEDKITTGEKIQCEVKGKRFSDYISSFHSQVVLPQDVKLEEVTVDESWEGSGENGIIDLYTADNKKGNFELISITISSTKEILDIESKITFTNTIVSDANFVEHELESADIVKQSKNIIPILISIRGSK